MVVSSATLTMRLVLCIAAHSCLNQANRRGLSIPPPGGGCDGDHRGGGAVTDCQPVGSFCQEVKDPST